MNKEKLKHKWKETNGFHISIYKINKQNSPYLVFLQLNKQHVCVACRH